MEKLTDSHGVRVRWRSFELRPRGAPPISPEYRARIEAGRPRLYAAARDQYGLILNPGPWGIDSRPALIGAKYAEEAGAGPAYHAAVFRAYWQDALSIQEVDVLAAVAEESGLDVVEFRQALTDPAWAAGVDEEIRLAREYGLTSVPALVFNDRYLVVGAQPYERLVDAVEEITGKDGA